MKTEVEAKNLDETTVEPKHTIEIVCQACGYDLDESELDADKCADCGATLNLRRNVAIEVTTLPTVFGETLE
tara:strand:- start:218 stop:433 length:216 start_codon:yes stop_codon:yes gene_type:complete